MPYMNQITLIGNLGSEVKLVNPESANPIANFSVATNHEYRNAAKQTVTETEWHRIVAYGQPAKFLSSYAKKGQSIMVQGRLRTRSYTDKNGIERSVTEIIVSDAQLLGGKREDNAGNTAQPAQAAAKQTPAPATTPAASQENTQNFPPLNMGEDDDIPF